MKILSVKKDKKHLMKILLDNNEEVSLDVDVCVDNALREGLNLSEADIEKLSFDSEYRRAKSRALWYLDRADHTEKALFTKLLRAGFEKRASAAAIGRLVELGVVDDLRFAERFAEKCSESNISKREALHKMLQKGVQYDMAKQVLEEIDTDESEQLNALIEKKYAYKLTQPNGVERVYAALVRKGFSYSAVRAALKKYTEELEFSEEY
jgi:regulatory protein